jgi:hypothetical protein
MPTNDNQQAGQQCPDLNANVFVPKNPEQPISFKGQPFVWDAQNDIRPISQTEFDLRQRHKEVLDAILKNDNAAYRLRVERDGLKMKLDGLSALLALFGPVEYAQNTTEPLFTAKQEAARQVERMLREKAQCAQARPLPLGGQHASTEHSLMNESGQMYASISTPQHASESKRCDQEREETAGTTTEGCLPKSH